MFYLSCSYRPKMSHTLTTNLALWIMSWLAKLGSKPVAFCFAHFISTYFEGPQLTVIKPRNCSYDWFTRRMWSKLNVAHFPVRTPEVAISTFKENALLLAWLPFALCWQVCVWSTLHSEQIYSISDSAWTYSKIPNHWPQNRINLSSLLRLQYQYLAAGPIPNVHM